MLERRRRLVGRKAPAEASPRDRRPAAPERRHNLFEAAAVYVAACAENDEQRSAEAARWVQPEALTFGVHELACRALIALARERDEPRRSWHAASSDCPPHDRTGVFRQRSS